MSAALFLQSPNPKELSFLNDSEKKNEYMSHIKSKLNFSQGSVIIDVGANVGVFSIQIAQYLSNLNPKIYSFEPFEKTFSCLESNTSSFAPIHCRQLAIGTKVGKRSGYFLPSYTLLSGFHVSEEDKLNLEKLAGGPLDEAFTLAEETVDCVRLDSFLETEGIMGKIDLIKIDVEKSELDVLHSLGSRLADVKSIAAEVHEHTLKEFTEILEKRYGHDNVWISPKDLPTFALNGQKPSDWDDSLNTYIVFAHE